MTGIARIILDHDARSVRISAPGVVHWLPSSLYEPMADLEAKYAAMDSAMRGWQALLEEAKREAEADG